jgi:hypothetical protein
MIVDQCHAEVLRSIWPICASKPDASEYLSMQYRPDILPNNVMILRLRFCSS